VAMNARGGDGLAEHQQARIVLTREKAIGIVPEERQGRIKDGGNGVSSRTQTKRERGRERERAVKKVRKREEDEYPP
jgi:hypothetical protein